MKTAIVYWGSKGGGVRQVQTYMRIAEQLNLPINWFLSTNYENILELQNQSRADIHITKIPRSRLEILGNIFRKTRAINDALEELISTNIDQIFFLLPHPWDITLAKKIAKKSKINIIRAIHDDKPHAGEFWPSKLTIRSMIKNSNIILTYSNYVARSIAIKSDRPIFTTRLYEFQKAVARKSSKIVLFLGRMKKYQGYENLTGAWPLVESKNFQLVIAGHQPKNKKSPIKGAIYINRWLSDLEIEALLEESSLVVLPYVEASQSGIVPLANAHNVPVVITPVGGLPEQVSNGVNGIIAKSISPKDIAEAIDTALKTASWNFEQFNAAEDLLKKLTSGYLQSNY